MFAQLDRSSDKAKALRKKGGAWLKKARLAAKLTQKQLADQLGLPYYTFVSQIEGGYGRIPPNLYEAYARALGIDAKEFARAMVMFYDPFTYKALFGAPADGVT